MTDKRDLPVKYGDEAMYESERMGRAEVEAPRVHLLSATPDPLGSIAAFCMMYEGKVVDDLAYVTDDQRRHYWQQANKTHLKAPLEAVDLHFMIEGVTRSFTHQMVRQRTAVYAQESLRFAVKRDLVNSSRPGPSIKGDPIREKIWEQAMINIGIAYQQLIEDECPAEDARGLLPHDVLTRLHYKTNLRNLLDHLGNRLCTQAQFEWRFVGSGIRQAIAKFQGYVTEYQIDGITGDHYPGGKVVKGDAWQWRWIAESAPFAPVCYSLGHCPFTASFDRHCAIRDRVQEGRFEDIKTEEWLLDPNAARR